MNISSTPVGPLTLLLNTERPDNAAADHGIRPMGQPSRDTHLDRPLRPGVSASQAPGPGMAGIAQYHRSALDQGFGRTNSRGWCGQPSTACALNRA